MVPRWGSGSAMATPGPCPALAICSTALPSTQAPTLRPCAAPQAPNKALASILGKSNLRFAGMSIAVSISTDGLNLSVPATRQVRDAHPAPVPTAPARRAL